MHLDLPRATESAQTHPCIYAHVRAETIITVTTLPQPGGTSHPLGIPKLHVYEAHDVQIHGSRSCWETQAPVPHEKRLSPWGLAWISAPLPSVGSLWVGLRGEWVGTCSPHRDRSGPTGSAGRVWPPRWALPRPSSVDVNLGASVDDAGSFCVPIPGVGLNHPPAFHSCLCAASPSPLPGSVP